MRFYELVLNYRNYLLIRLRYNYLRSVTSFLDAYREDYENAVSVNRLLHEATGDIVSQYFNNKAGSRHWEEKLIDVFANEKLDGLNRYYAIVRLTFIYYNYKEFHKLVKLYDQLDKLILKGEIYSKRILVNYYANRLLLHSRFNELDKAAYYGYLSIRVKSSDYLFYVNNLCGILLRREKFAEALKLMRNNLPEMRNTISPHNRIGFVSYYVKSLNKNKKAKQGLEYAKKFLEINKSDILNFRWRPFFLSYIESMLQLEQYNEVLKCIRKYGLLKLELEYKERPGYVPSLIWYEQIARYKECQINAEELINRLQNTLYQSLTDKHKEMQIKNLIEESSPHIAELATKLMMPALTKDSTRG